MYSAISMFDGSKPKKIIKPVRLIELFAGIGAQHKALANLKIDFKPYRICEFDKYAVQSYNAVHGTNFKPSDITKINAEDLGIVETDKYEYIMTYSFPCTDLSMAGQRKGMTKGSGTRSGLLWEVERLLKGCKELPQVLLMENVPQVLCEAFGGWLEFLDKKGHKNYYKILNAKDYGIPQNRDRCFMVSVLGDYYYDFPKEIPLELRLRDMLETEVDEKYYLTEKAIKGFERRKKFNEDTGRHFWWKPLNENSETAFCIKAANKLRNDDNFIKEPRCEQIANLNYYGNDQMNRVYSPEGISPTVETVSGGGRETKIAEPTIWGSKQAHCAKNTDGICPTLTEAMGMGGGQVPLHNYEFIPTSLKFNSETQTITTLSETRTVEEILTQPQEGDTLTVDGKAYAFLGGAWCRVRKLTPRECWRLMGFTDSDFDRAKASGVSDSQLYKQAGNSIVVPVLEAIFNQLF